jgi:Tat protein secretion system quality control protein TatD with DNase activity
LAVIGLDLYRDDPQFERQQACSMRSSSWRSADLPVILHSRHAR